MTLVLEAIHLSKHYSVRRGLFRGTATVRALNDVTLFLEEGKTLAVVGESGCGKSTLARAVTMIEPPTFGQILYDGRDVVGRSAAEMKELRRTVQMVFQNPYGSLNPRKTVGSILTEPLVINTNLRSKERRELALAMMAKVGLRADQIDRYPHMFSGGQRQRIAIARALMLNPRVVVADEPVSALDVSIQAQVLNLMMDLQDELKLAYLFISHDLSVVRHIADTVMVMYLGNVVEKGPKEMIFQRPRHPYTRVLLAATPRVNPELRAERLVAKGELPSPLNPPPGCPFHRRCPYARENCAVDVPALHEIAPQQLVACHYAEEIT